MMSRADDRLVQTSKVATLVLLALHVGVVWVCQPFFRMGLRFYVIVGALGALV